MANFEKIKNLALQLTALICVNLLAFIYDSQWLYVAVALDCATLGFNLSAILPKVKTDG